MKTGILFDIGGTWIKGASLDVNSGSIGRTERIKSPLPCTDPADISKALKQLSEAVLKERKPDIIAVSTAGVVDDFGHSVTLCSEHLKPLDDKRWIEYLEEKLEAPVVLCSDAEAAIIGAACKGYLKGNKNIALFVAGTGLGFSVWRNGRRWRPGRNYPLLGSVTAGNRSFDSIVSVSALADGDNRKLVSVLTEDRYKEKREIYFAELASILNSAAIIYSLDEILFASGLVNAAAECGFPLNETIQKHLSEGLTVTILNEGNTLQMQGIANLAINELTAEKVRFRGNHSEITTEKKFRQHLNLQDKTAAEVVDVLWKAEQEAGEKLQKSLNAVAKTAEKIAEQLKKGGRIIYVGCGTSGRVAAMDDVELSCTFGLPEDRSLTLVSGGIADSALSIEVDFEEDSSAIPETLLLNLNKNDVLIGISASSTAYYVRSALTHAKSVGALTVLISEAMPERNDFFDLHIPLHTGPEVISGSTRMKAGTATKKILNMLSSTTMILLGKIEDCYMIDVACVNEKLIRRAEKILTELYGWDTEKCEKELKEADYRLIDIVQRERGQ